MNEIFDLIPSTGTSTNDTYAVVHNSHYSVAERRGWVADLYFKGVAPSIIFNQYQQKYNLTKHSMDKDITAIREAMEDQNVRDSVDSIINDQYRVLSSLQATAIATGDTSTTINATHHIINLLKLVVPHGNKRGGDTNIQINNTSFSTMSPAELLKYLGR